ncbi:MAG: bacteriocin-protection protein [Gemmatimonadetes bacterium]|nr:YdeI/OmpD-associated family protein [Gemmatimonadota bacterium]MYA40775.1 bacteriocin-protection protein [Gemmatimonadota bacterium]MYE94294.1 bacteriocin-protection protein [Gemmatimonadota bacterium]MYJ09708.1 bacteriocin-protection protein [Gemmatimonadota bacterium]
MRAWLEENHDRVDELWVGYYKKGTGLPSVTWPESVDEALCFGWIDGIRKSIDDRSYRIRFTPRRRRSHWSARNLGRMDHLMAEGLVAEVGLAAFRARDPEKQERASYEQREAVVLPPEYEQRLRAEPDAWKYFRAARPSYRKQVTWWVVSAKREETRLRRLGILIESSARGEVIPPLRWAARKKG